MRRWFILKFDEKRFAKELRENRIFLLSAAARYLRFSFLHVSRVIVRNQRMARGILAVKQMSPNVRTNSCSRIICLTLVALRFLVLRAFDWAARAGGERQYQLTGG